MAPFGGHRIYGYWFLIRYWSPPLLLDHPNRTNIKFIFDLCDTSFSPPQLEKELNFIHNRYYYSLSLFRFENLYHASNDRS